MMTFEIAYPPTKRGKAAWNKRFGLNAYYAGKCWQQRKRDAEELHFIAHAAMRSAGIPRKLTEDPVSIHFYWDDNLDVDNHAVIGKAVVDAMKGWILPDDNKRWVREVAHSVWGGGKIRVEVRPCRR